MVVNYLITLSKADRGDLLVLGLLHQRPRHGYELKQILSGPLSLLGGNLVSTLYYTLRRLAHRRFIASDQLAGPNGRFPPRTLWRLTPLGESHLPGLCQEALSDLSCPSVLPLAIMVTQGSHPEALQEALQFRRSHLNAHVIGLGQQAMGDELGRDPSMKAWTILTAQLCESEARWIDAHLDGQPIPSIDPEITRWQLFAR